MVIPPGFLLLLRILSLCRKMKIDLFLTLYKAQVQVDQGPQHKTRYTESNRRESGKEP